MASHGIAIEKTIQWPGGGESFYFRDPSGNSLEFAMPAIWRFSESESSVQQHHATIDRE